jgi:hypothetical protein
MKKRPRDPAQLATLMIDIASGEVEDKISAPNTPASEFARQGGLKGGRARADKPNNVTKPRRILRGYAAYYNVSRTHRSLNKDARRFRKLHPLDSRPPANQNMIAGCSLLPSFSSACCATVSSRDDGLNPKSWCCGINSTSCSYVRHGASY